MSQPAEGPVPPFPVTDDGGAQRLARLRPQHAAAYPGLDAGVWYPARSVAEYFLAWLVRHPGPAGGSRARTLDAGHFEFRGGVPREAPWVEGRSPDQRRA